MENNYVHQNSTVLASNLKRTQWGFKVAFRFLKVTSESASISVIYLLSLLEENGKEDSKVKIAKNIQRSPTPENSRYLPTNFSNLLGWFFFIEI